MEEGQKVINGYSVIGTYPGLTVMTCFLAVGCVGGGASIGDEGITYVGQTTDYDSGVMMWGNFDRSDSFKSADKGDDTYDACWN